MAQNRERNWQDRDQHRGGWQGGEEFERGQQFGSEEQQGRGFRSEQREGGGQPQGAEWGRMGRYGEEGWRGGQGRWSQSGNYGMDRDYGQSGSRGAGLGGGFGRSGYGMAYGPQQAGRDFWDRASDEVSSWFGDDAARRRREQDEHRGRGPKGYTRSDDRIREDVNDRLTDDGWLDASDIEVQVASSEVTLTGQVNSREEKRRAEDIVESVSGVKHVQNNLRVKDRSVSAGQASTTQFGAAPGTSGKTSSSR